MRVVGIIRGRAPDDEDEALVVCEFCGRREFYVFKASEPYEAAVNYYRGRPCERCGRISETKEKVRKDIQNEVL